MLIGAKQVDKLKQYLLDRIDALKADRELAESWQEALKLDLAISELEGALSELVDDLEFALA